ncbi:MAG: ribosomal protein S18-alanine N-acetyltransferase [Caldimicrobium sp.]
MLLLLKKDSVKLPILYRLSVLEKEIFNEKAWSFNMIKEETKNPFSYIFVLLKDREPVGYLLARLFLEEGEILRLAVKQEFRGQGLGRYLLENFLFEAYNNEIRKIYLEVSEKNIKAIIFYKNLGFRAVGVRKNYYAPGEDGIIMEYILENKRKLLEWGGRL